MLHGLARATREILGEEEHARVVREHSHLLESFDGYTGDDWVPVEHAAEYCELVFSGLDDERVRKAARLTNDYGLSSARKLMLAVATPHGLLRRSSEIFRHQFSDGRMVAYATSPCSAVVSIYDHRFNDTPLLRTISAESVRYLLTLTGAKHVTEQHNYEDGGPLIVLLTWD